MSAVRIHDLITAARQSPTCSAYSLPLLLLHGDGIINEVITVKFQYLPGLRLHGLPHNAYCLSCTLQTTTLLRSLVVHYTGVLQM